MRKFLLFLAPVLLSGNLFSQDLIVTADGDSMNCRITRIKGDNIYFTFRYKDEIRSTLLPVSQVRYHQTGYYQVSEVPDGRVARKQDYRHFRLALNGGFGYHLARISDDVPDDFVSYAKRMKSGLNLNGDMAYYISEVVGIGLRYSLFKTSNEMNDIYVEDEFGNRRYGIMSDDLAIHFIGPSMSTRLLSRNKKNELVTNLSLGYIHYFNDKVVVDSYNITGGTIGMSLDITYDIGITEKISLGIQASLLSASLYSYNYDNGVTIQKVQLEAGGYENLSRVDLSFGIRFSL